MNPYAEAAREKKKWEQSVGVGTLDKLFSVLNGEKINYSEADFIGSEKPEEQHIDYDNLTEKLGIKVAQVAPSEQEVNSNHIKAIEKYPSLINMLGEDDSNELSEVIASAINSWIIGKIHKNSSSINKQAIECKQEDNSLKEYFKYEDKVGFVKAAGKFTGKEYLHYDNKNNQAYVLVKNAQNKWDNVSQNFNLEFQFVEIEK